MNTFNRIADRRNFRHPASFFRPCNPVTTSSSHFIIEQLNFRSLQESERGSFTLTGETIFKSLQDGQH